MANRKRSRRSRSKTKGLSKLQKKEVKDMCLSAGETKVKEYFNSEVKITSEDATPYAFNLLNISKGSSGNQRIGLQLRLIGFHHRKFFHNANYTLADGTVQSKAGIVRECVIRIKNEVNNLQAENHLFLKNGNVTAFSLTNEKERYYLPLNTKSLDVIYERTHKLARKSNAIAGINYDNNKIVSTFKKQSKVIKYLVDTPDSGEQVPNYQYIYMAWVCTADMDSDASNYTDIELSSSMRVFYKDQ